MEARRISRHFSAVVNTLGSIGDAFGPGRHQLEIVSSDYVKLEAFDID
jgi:hypothetical protein